MQFNSRERQGIVLFNTPSKQPCLGFCFCEAYTEAATAEALAAVPCSQAPSLYHVRKAASWFMMCAGSMPTFKCRSLQWDVLVLSTVFSIKDKQESMTLPVRHTQMQRMLRR